MIADFIILGNTINSTKIEKLEDSSKRRIEAILFSDIKGYTSLMQEHEEHAAAVLRRFQSVMHHIIPQFGGKIVNEIGDGMVCIFPSPLESVRCAIELTKQFAEHIHVPVRLGLHMGTVVHEGEKIYGNSLNVASRIESMGIPGAILASNVIRNEVKNYPEYSFKSLGKFKFKNIQEPLEVYAISNHGLVVPKKSILKGKFIESKSNFLIAAILLMLFILVGFLGKFLLSKPKEIITKSDKSIAVLPFNNESRDSENLYFCNGMMEAILNHLSKINDLRVISRTSVEIYRKMPT